MFLIIFLILDHLIFCFKKKKLICKNDPGNMFNQGKYILKYEKKSLKINTRKDNLLNPLKSTAGIL
jgi:hypothetical protein